MFGGAKGPGKTDCLIAEATRFVTHPKYHGLILRRTFPRLQEIVDRCWALYPQLGAQFREKTNRWTFPSGARITLGHCQNEVDKHNYHGKEFHFLGFDELTEFLESQYLFILANVRKSVPDLPLRIRATTNPGGGGHTWVKERFVTPCKSAETVEYPSADGTTRKYIKPKVYIDPDSGTSRCFVPATVYDNPSITINDPGYVRRLEMLPEIEKMRLLYGDWDAFAGQVFAELSVQSHGCDPFPIPPEWEKFMVFDWGYGRPWAALWFAVDFDGALYLYRARYGMGKGEDGKPDPNKGLRQTNSEICHEIISIEKRERIPVRIADPACWGPTKIRGSNTVLGPSFAEDAANEGLYFLRADNDRLRGKQQCHERFRLEEEIDQQTGEVLNETPRFYAFKHDEFGDCGVRRWWDEMLNLREDPKNVEDVDTDQPDEGYDCTRYAFLSRPIMPKRVERIPAGTFAAERRRLIRAREFARRHGVSLAAAYARVR